MTDNYKLDKVLYKIKMVISTAKFYDAQISIDADDKLCD